MKSHRGAQAGPILWIQDYLTLFMKRSLLVAEIEVAPDRSN
ncbi:unnamed protein product [Acidithrix sp. C25]|nr:unnamed protein product [Acidithrix sp. C25]